MAACLRESAMDAVDESGRLVELPPQLGALPAMKRCAAHREATITLGFYPRPTPNEAVVVAGRSTVDSRVITVGSGQTDVRAFTGR
jgi:hypothetical protein